MIRFIHNGAVVEAPLTDNSIKNLKTLFPHDVVELAVVQAKVVAAQEGRKSAYKSESDPLYMEWQYDKTPEKEQAWRDKVSEIKLRIPLPEDVS